MCEFSFVAEDLPHFVPWDVGNKLDDVMDFESCNCDKPKMDIERKEWFRDVRGPKHV